MTGVRSTCNMHIVTEWFEAQPVRPSDEAGWDPGGVLSGSPRLNLGGRVLRFPQTAPWRSTAEISSAVTSNGTRDYLQVSDCRYRYGAEGDHPQIWESRILTTRPLVGLALAFLSSWRTGGRNISLNPDPFRGWMVSYSRFSTSKSCECHLCVPQEIAT